MKSLRIPPFIAGVALLMGLTFSACDDRYGDELRSIGHRVEALEDSLLRINSDMELLSQILVTIQRNGYVTNIVELPDGTYSITFNDGRTFVLRDGLMGRDGRDGQDGKAENFNINVRQDGDSIWYWTLNGEWLLNDDGERMPVTGEDGKDGKDGKDGTDGKDGADGANGKDGSTPVVGLQQDEDGVWYWTLNGEWLLDAQGAKVKAVGSDGKDGVTPQLKIEAGYWYISYDEGQTWTYVGQATGNNGKDGTNGKDGKDGVDGKDGKDGTSFFKSVTQDFDYVYLTLANGTVITMPKFLPLSITFSNTADTLEVTKQQLLKINYHFQASTDKYHIEAITSSDIACILSVPVVTEDKGIYYGEGILSIQVGDFVDAFSRVTVFFSDERTLLMRKYAFKKRKAE